MRDLINRLNQGTLSFDFVGRWKRWFIISAVIVIVSLGSLVVRPLNLGIEFLGGADFQAPTQVTDATIVDTRDAVEATGLPDLDAVATTIGENTVRVQTRTLDVDEVVQVRTAIAEQVGVSGDEVAYSLIGASWGEQISQRAGIALAIFLVLVALTIWIYFRDWRMSVAALIALVHDLVVTIGVYALIGFSVTPATVISVLTILGYSLYDTVVVFDKVRENVAGIKEQRRTYSNAANSALNSVLVRSLNTTIIGVLPVIALLIAGAGVLGQGPLQDLSLALFIGMLAGAYSSVFLATPILALLREREPDMVEHRAALARREAKEERTAQRRSASSVAVLERDPNAAAADGAATVVVEDAPPDEATRPTTGGTPGSTGGSGGSSAPLSDGGSSRRPQPRRSSRSERRRT